MSLTREQILAVGPPAPMEVHVPEWGGSVFVRQMSAADRDRFETESSRLHAEDRLAGRQRALVTVFSCADEQGRLLFTLADVEAVAALGSLAVERVATLAMRLNKLSEDEVLEEAKK
jgi:hypothetical protein